MCLLTWLGTYMGTVRISITKAVEQYAQLPKSPPSCYVCTAAAHGHRDFVGSHSCRASDGTVFSVNRQMRRLKCAELALAVTAPWLHAAVRRVYDCIGPRLARRLRHPLAADFAFLAFKPVEWLAVFVQRSVVPNFDDLTEWLYSSPPDGGQISSLPSAPRKSAPACAQRGPRAKSPPPVALPICPRAEFGMDCQQ
jgi:hypothetical protein